MRAEVASQGNKGAEVEAPGLGRQAPEAVGEIEIGADSVRQG